MGGAYKTLSEDSYEEFSALMDRQPSTNQKAHSSSQEAERERERNFGGKSEHEEKERKDYSIFDQ